MTVTVFDVIGAAFFALAFIFAMSLVKEPHRQAFNAIFVAGAGAAYLSSGFGLYEFLFTTAATITAYLGLKSYRFIAISWLMHSAWDLLHHIYGDPIIIFVPNSSVGCAVFDLVIAIWFWCSAPNLAARIFDSNVSRP